MNLHPGRFVEFVEERGLPLQVGERRITPVARTLRVSLSWAGTPAAASFLWTRPVAVEVAEAAGQRRVPIRDVNRLAMLGIWAVALLPALWLARRAWRRDLSR